LAGEMVEFQANGRMGSGYMALPPSGTGPGVIVIQEWWGLVPHIQDLVDRFAAAGFAALAPDLYHGETTRSPDEAGKKLMALDIANAGKDLRGAAEFLAGTEGVSPKRVAAIGFCMGGQLALFAASEYPELFAASVDFYGIHPNVHPRFEKMDGAVLAHFATRDKSVPPETARELVRSIENAGKKIEAHFYDADHAFFNDTRSEVYDEGAARLAWSRTLDFLRRELV
jgi:carboxymethylenebutenolidase